MSYTKLAVYLFAGASGQACANTLVMVVLESKGIKFDALWMLLEALIFLFCFCMSLIFKSINERGREQNEN